MERLERKQTASGYSDDVHNIVGAALFALGQGAQGIWINLPAIQSFRRRFAERVRSAVKEPDWRAHWQRENVYLLAHAEAMGERAAELATMDGRAFITEQDIEEAMMKVRGRLPIAGRWAPL